ncbi:MAG TPA: pyrroline-5-carboxylate reductase [Clostridia bacterium]|nr:pyrroline-5-carboxylate reductase [Clostridia bacterium]
MSYRLGIIGAGVMANALVSQMLKTGLHPEEIIVYDIDSEKSASIHPSAHVAASDNEVISQSDMILFSVKPQHYKEITENNVFSDDKIVISIMAGVKIEVLRKNLRSDCGILRVMPNMPCKIAKGVCALCFDKINQQNKEFLLRLFASCGDIIEISEDKFDAVTSVSGSGPAYVYMFLQGMIEGGMRGGLTYEESKKLAVATLIGGTELAKISSDDLNVMIDRVCSKGGTTIEAVDIYRQKGLVDIVAEGIDACRAKSKLLSEKL